MSWDSLDSSGPGRTEIESSAPGDLETAVAQAHKAITRVRELAFSQGIRPDDFALRAIRLLNAQLAHGRRAAARLSEADLPADEHRRIITELNAAIAGVRRLTLYVQAQIFRLDPTSR